MSCLFVSILKFCSTKHLVIYLKRRYSQCQVEQLNGLVRLNGKCRTGKVSARFLRACLRHNVVPGFITKRIISSKMKHSTSVERMLILDEIGRLNRTRSARRRVRRNAWNEARGFMSLCDTIRLCRYIAAIDQRAEMVAQKKCDRTIDWLKVK